MVYNAPMRESGNVERESSWRDSNGVEGRRASVVTAAVVVVVEHGYLPYTLI